MVKSTQEIIDEWRDNGWSVNTECNRNRPPDEIYAVEVAETQGCKVPFPVGYLVTYGCTLGIAVNLMVTEIKEKNV